MLYRVLNMPPVLNMPAIFNIQVSEYAGVVICQGSEYASFSEYVSVLGIPCFCQDMSGLHRVLNMHEYDWIIPGYACMCLNVTGFYFIFTHCNALSQGIKDCFLEK